MNFGSIIIIMKIDDLAQSQETLRSGDVTKKSEFWKCNNYDQD